MIDIEINIGADPEVPVPAPEPAPTDESTPEPTIDEPTESHHTIHALQLEGDRGKLTIYLTEGMPRPLHASEYSHLSSDVTLGTPPFAFISPHKQGKATWRLEPLMDNPNCILINDEPPPLDGGLADAPEGRVCPVFPVRKSRMNHLYKLDTRRR